MLRKFAWNDEELKGIWEKFYQGNVYLFPYASWAYNDIVFRYEKIKPQTIWQKNYFYVYYENDIPLMIMPLSIKHGDFIVFGENISGAEYADFVYDAEITDRQIIQAIRELRDYHKGKKLRLQKINEKSRLHQCFINNIDILQEEFGMQYEKDRICVKINFDDDYNEYFQQLTKKSRQNIRTAYNKFKTNDIDMKLEVISGELKSEERLEKVFKVYTKRSEEWMNKHRACNYIKYLKNRYFSVLSWGMQRLKEQYTFCFLVNEELAAFMTGFLMNNNELTVPMVSMDSDFSKFSPGRLMISESIKHLQKNTKIRCIDVSRGDERYKFDMGGHAHYNYRYVLNL